MIVKSSHQNARAIHTLVYILRNVKINTRPSHAAARPMMPLPQLPSSEPMSCDSPSEAESIVMEVTGGGGTERRRTLIAGWSATHVFMFAVVVSVPKLASIYFAIAIAAPSYVAHHENEERERPAKDQHFYFLRRRRWDLVSFAGGGQADHPGCSSQSPRRFRALGAGFEAGLGAASVGCWPRRMMTVLACAVDLCVKCEQRVDYE